MPSSRVAVRVRKIRISPGSETFGKGDRTSDQPGIGTGTHGRTSDSSHNVNSPFHAVPEVSWIVRIAAVIVVGVNKGVDNTHNHDFTSKASSKGLSSEVVRQTISSKAHSSISPESNNDVVTERALVVVRERIRLARASDSALFALHRQHGTALPRICHCIETRRIPTANLGREARAASQIAMRRLLIGPKILEARAAIGIAKSRFLNRGTEQGRGGLLFLIAGRVGNSASMIHMTHVFTGLHGAMYATDVFKNLSSHSEVRSEKGDTVVFTSSTDFLKAVDECARIGSRSKPGSKANDTDPLKKVDTKAAHRSST